MLAMPQLLRFPLSPAVVTVSHLALMLSAAALSSIAPSPNCPSKCGSIDIPYPFGLSDECAWTGGGLFTVDCDHSFNPPRPFTGNIEITDISVETAEMHVYAIVASVCYNSSNTIDDDQSSFNITWSLDPAFLISPTENVFTAIGCETLAFLEGGSNYLSGCISTCASLDDSAVDGDPCTGLGCCQSSIPGNLSTIAVFWSTDKSTIGNNSAWEYSPCSNAFVAQKDWYNFSRQDLKGMGNGSFSNRVGDRSVPLVLDWAIRGNGSCKKVPETSGVSVTLTAPACASANSYCEDLDATRGGGYLCKCSKGYTGNPYILNGCTNINECNSETKSPCGFYSTCEDTDGDYNCKCQFNRKGNGKSEEGCHQYIFSPYAMAAVATFVAIVFGLIVIILVLRRNRRKLFNKNGGKILAAQNITIYTQKDVEKITKGRKKRIGNGYFGEVYEGRIDGAQAQLVAVKFPVATNVVHAQKILIPHQVQQHEQDEGGFVNEITFQFTIKHTNMVKLLGCCLETEIPILVFEFVPNGNLRDALHSAKPCTISLLKRLDIAIGSAEALSHMHSYGDHKHVHGDIKPANILLDENLNPKVSDFGSSKLLSMHNYFKGIVAGDMSYIDPVYLQTQRFTVKSDVYSFGVVLLELITGKMAMYDGDKSLPVVFDKVFKDNGSGRMMFDTSLLSGDQTQSQRHVQCLDRIGMLAVRCLQKDDVEKRPTMPEVVEELERVKVMASGGSSSFRSVAS